MLNQNYKKLIYSLNTFAFIASVFTHSAFAHQKAVRSLENKENLNPALGIGYFSDKEAAIILSIHGNLLHQGVLSWNHRTRLLDAPYSWDRLVKFEIERKSPSEGSNNERFNE